jgi:uncharacterized membrane protein YcgQ (UPF0703/DUF1980 family)
MAHSHTHSAQEDTYYLDQLCLIGISAAFGAICLTLYFWQTDMLKLLLDVQFHPYVLVSGIVLLTLVVVRSVVLWRAAAAPSSAPAHTHTHDHDHAHDHDHDHGHGHAHDRHHHHDHDHDHGHDHHHHDHAPGHAHDHGHDHSWAPWRYVVLLVPIMLFALGLPQERPGVEGGEVDTTRETLRDALHMIALANHTLLPSALPAGPIAAAAALTAPPTTAEAPVFLDDAQAALKDLQPGMPVLLDVHDDGRLEEIRAGKTTKQPQPGSKRSIVATVKAVDVGGKLLTVTRSSGSIQQDSTFDLAQGPVTGVDFGTLHAIAFNPALQRKWNGKTVQVVGQFAPYPQSDRAFKLARYRIQCCGADAIQLDIPIVSRESIRGVQRNDWVKVTGRVEFREVPGRAGKMTYLLVARRENIQHTSPEPDPYIR